MSSKPIIAVTMGDPAGIGPEIVLKAVADPAVRKAARPLILGDWGVLQRTRVGANKSPELICWRPGQSLLAALNHPTASVVCALSSLSRSESRQGVGSKAGGHSAFRYIRVAARLALLQLVDAIATAPISKHNLVDAGYPYPGHTELLAELSRSPDCRMMLVGDKLRVVPVTGHIPYTRVARDLTRVKIQTTVELTDGGLRAYFALRRPRIAVAALNPHAGEKGMFGREEIDIIAPAVKRARSRGISVVGPLPADSLFHHAALGEYDAVVCMYHDQGLIPLKLHHFFGGVALTLGLPFIRTSVDHGTAYDIAGTGKADATSMKEAILLAAGLARRYRGRRKR